MLISMLDPFLEGNPMFLLMIDSILTQLQSYLLLIYSTYSVDYTLLFGHPIFSIISCTHCLIVKFGNTETVDLLGSC
jgi:hypothetical protein